MPELPEVETVVRDLRACGLVGLQIMSAHVFWPRSVAAPAPARLSAAIRGNQILGLSRRGKFIRIELSGKADLLIHLRMTGRLYVVPAERAATGKTYDRVVFTLSDGRGLSFSDPRKFGRVWLMDNPDALLDRLGPEPLSLPRATFVRRLAARSRTLKPLLMDQTFIAGIGNIYADEALWAAQLHPQRKSDSLSTEEAARVHRTIKMVLRRGIRNLGTSLGAGHTNFRLPRGEPGRNREHLCAYGQTGRPCERCHTPIVRILVGQRATHFCPVCQPQ
ncbi:MAG: DNA-formamidopyrimidine glycosylase [Kiritimatiellia bacterium]|jgi:formamidopyrimidine-DNA glycosylase|nr:DNA-formamidopyrimidine glycosylase [Kiritimatiellia bacterium]